MSWLARSIANSLKLDDEDADVVSDPDQSSPQKNSPSHAEEQNDDPSSPTSPSRGVKEDISELTKTFTRQFWGVASFLAPPPEAEPDKYPRVSDLTESHKNSELNSDSEDSEQVGIGGIKSDFAEIGGKFRSGISKLSSNIAVSEFTKIASNLLQMGSDDEGEEEEESGKEENVLGINAVGVTDEAVAFARDISMHPGTWLDFPLPGNEDDDSFELSDVQQEHALAVEHLVPLLSSLRMELCPGCMSESLFWKIYFVLLHPQLNEQDAALLSTSPVLETRALLSHKLPNHATPKHQESNETGIVDVSSQKLQLQAASIDTSLRIPTEKHLEAFEAEKHSEAFEAEKHSEAFEAEKHSEASEAEKHSEASEAEKHVVSLHVSTTENPEASETEKHSEASEAKKSDVSLPVHTTKNPEAFETEKHTVSQHIPTSTEKNPEASEAEKHPEASEKEKHGVESSEIGVVDKSMIEDEKHVDQMKDIRGSSQVEEEDDYDEWLNEEESSEHVGPTNNASSSSMVNAEENEDDVSFSDLEDDDDKDKDKDGETRVTTESSSKKITTRGKNNSKDSIDWLDVDVDIDDS